MQFEIGNAIATFPLVNGNVNHCRKIASKFKFVCKRTLYTWQCIGNSRLRQIEAMQFAAVCKRIAVKFTRAICIAQWIAAIYIASVEVP